MASRERSPALRIGIISDTHGSLDPRAYAALADCDHIIHAGDICGPAILRELETLAPVTAVLGNNDFDEYGSEVGHFAHPVLGGVRFLVGHKPGDVRVSFAGSAGLRPAARRHRARAYPRTRTRGRPRGAAREHLFVPRRRVPPPQRFRPHHRENGRGRRPHPAHLDREPRRESAVRGLGSHFAALRPRFCSRKLTVVK